MALMIKHHIFVNKHLSVQTQRKVNISKRNSICSNLLKILNKDTTAMPLMYLLNGMTSRDSKHRTAPHPNISWKFSKNYKSAV